jgi:hypothetical protein
MTTFDIRDQQATTIQNVGGDMVVHGGFSSSTGSQYVEPDEGTIASRLGRLTEALHDAPWLEAAWPSSSRCSGWPSSWARPGTPCSASLAAL